MSRRSPRGQEVPSAGFIPRTTKLPETFSSVAGLIKARYQAGLSTFRAHNSAVECVLHTDEVAGSIPAAPTRNPSPKSAFCRVVLRRLSSKAALFGLSLGLLCCAPRAAGPVRSIWLPAWAFGTFGGGDLDLRDVCPRSAASEVSVGSSWGTLGISLATLGVYTPRVARVRCAPSP